MHIPDALSLTAILNILCGVAVCVIGGMLGGRCFLYLLFSAMSAYTAYALVQAFALDISAFLQNYTRPLNATLIAVGILVLPPVLLLPLLFRWGLVKLRLVEKLDPALDSILGASLSLLAYLIIKKLW